MPNPQPLVEIRGVTKRYEQLEVLHSVDLDILPAAVTTIVGASGAGKTTLLQILGTMLRPDAGTVSFSGQNVFALKSKELARFRNQSVGFVFQFHHLLPEFTALENVCIPALIHGVRFRRVRERAAELLDFLGLGARLQHKPHQLSGGEQQRVAVARALINEPQLILADEPSGNLDTGNKAELHGLFFRLRDELRQSFVIVTHDPDLARQSDRVVRMADGKILAPHDTRS